MDRINLTCWGLICRISVEMATADHRAIAKKTIKRTLLSIREHLNQALSSLNEIAADNGIDLDGDDLSGGE
ncbi:MAG: hypothetical protein F6K31_12370 [Symploca sp. SIO2G7]|nr:hypothetical protein [Symploca sp. SIO2G7]